MREPSNKLSLDAKGLGVNAMVAFHDQIHCILLMNLKVCVLRPT